jgi:serine-type D-Ala-D-Ala carboxypeptidase (penicillin-binding protein 5/6)
MHRRGIVAFLLWLVLGCGVAAPLAGAASPPSTEAPPPQVPAAYIVVDVDTGNIVSQADSRTLHPPASTIKLMTALIAAERLPATDVVPISPLAESMPARKINVKAGQTWTLNDLMHCLLMISANDAAVAVAERVGGSLDGFTAIAQATADRLGLVDKPVFNDPAGLDDEFAHGGGSFISARDLAIVARAVLARPDLMAIIGKTEYSFTGGDGLGHHFTNHNLFLGMYAGATGMKTGTTDKAGSTFVGSATRNGRTMLTVELNAPDAYRSAAVLLDQGFATPVASESKVDALPAVVKGASVATTTPPPVAEGSAAAAPAKHAGSKLDINSPMVAAAILLAGVIALVIVRRSIVLRHAAHRGDAQYDD